MLNIKQYCPEVEHVVVCSNPADGLPSPLHPLSLVPNFS